MKKLLLMLLCGALMLSFNACNDEKKPDQPPKADPPAWEEFIEEYDEWATEYANWQISFKADPNNPVAMDALTRWPSEIEEWNTATAEMLEALKDFKEERAAFIAEVNEISKKITGMDTDEATSDDVQTFLSEYDAWADKYVAFYAAYADNTYSQEYRDGVNNLIFESIDWTSKINVMTSRINDAELLVTFTAGIADIAAKVAGAHK